MASGATWREGFPALVTAMAHMGEQWLRGGEPGDRQAEWERAAGAEAGDAAATLAAGLDLLADRLDALRREVRLWGARLWQEDAANAAALPGRLRLLDDLVALLAAARRLPPLGEPRFAGHAARIRELYEAEEAFYRSGSWRLIPFNEARRARLAEIGPKLGYLFPWYEEWSDVPADALDALVVHLAGREAVGPDAGRLALLAAEIEREPEDAALLARCVFAERELPEIAARAWALRWLTAAEDAGASAVSTPLRLADALPLLRIIRRGASPLEWRLQAACLLPGLERRERLRLLRRVEDELETTLARSRADAPPRLLAWLDGDTDDAGLIAGLSEEWTAAPEDKADARKTLDRSALLAILESDGVEAGKRAEALLASPGGAGRRERGEGILQALLPGLRLSFRWPTLALGTAAASALVMLTVLHQPETGAPVALTMQVFGQNQVQLRGDAERPGLSAPFELQDGGALRSGDAYRIRVLADRDAHLYLLVSSNGAPPELLLEERLRAGETRELPGGERLFRLDQSAGTERIYALIGEKPLPVRETLARGLPDGREETLRAAFPEAGIHSFRLEHR